MLLLGLGVRGGEALGVRRRDVNFARNTVRVWKGKTHQSSRTLSMPRFVMNGLQEHLAVRVFDFVSVSGRGLRILAAIAADWGVEPLPGKGKCVWSELTS